MVCYYCNEELKHPYARYGDHELCGSCAAQVEHQHMVTRGDFILHIEQIGTQYFIDNEIGTLEFKVVKSFTYWKHLYTYEKILRIWFLDKLGYLWTGYINVKKIPGPIKVFRYHRKVLGCMRYIDAPIRRKHQQGDQVIFHVDGRKKYLSGVVTRYSDKLRMYAVEPKEGRQFLAPEKYLAAQPTDQVKVYPDVEIYVDDVLAWRGYARRLESVALRLAAQYDYRLRGPAQRRMRFTFGEPQEWDGRKILIKWFSAFDRFTPNEVEIDADATTV